MGGRAGGQTPKYLVIYGRLPGRPFPSAFPSFLGELYYPGLTIFVTQIQNSRDFLNARVLTPCRVAFPMSTDY